MKRRALGKGLKSLIPDAKPQAAGAPATPSEPPAGENLRLLDLDLIRPNPYQPRESFDAGALEELAASMRGAGVLQPIVVRPKDGGYELIAGERRWRAAQLAGLLKIPAIVREVPDEQLLEVALIENLQREALNPIDEARAYHRLTTELGLSQQEVAERVGKQRTTIANTLRLLALPEPIQQMVRRSELSGGHARALLPVSDPRRQMELARRAVEEAATVRQLEQWVARERLRKAKGASSGPPRRDPNLVAAEERLQRALGTRVRIYQGARGGRLEIYFHSEEELSGLYELLLRVARPRPHADKQVGD